MKAKVINAFRERLQNFRLYNIDDFYEVEDENRAKYLESQGFLAIEDDSSDFDPATTVDLEGFLSLSAADQKKLMSYLGIEGDYGNAEKREELYKAYLHDSEVKPNGDPNSN